MLCNFLPGIKRGTNSHRIKYEKLFQVDWVVHGIELVRELPWLC